MKITFLYSGSRGNCTIVESNGTTFIIDIGITYKKFTEHYKNKIDAVLITHEHTDHIKGLNPLSRAHKETVTFIPELSYEASKHNFNKVKPIFINRLTEYIIGDIKFKPFTVRHDSKDNVGYILTSIKDNITYGHLTDTGIITPYIHDKLKSCDALFIESDYDYYQLDEYPGYPDYLKMRIQSYSGHLSNQVVVSYLKTQLDLAKIKWIMLGHLSENTNSPDTLQKLIDKHINKKHQNKINIFKQKQILNI